MKPAPSPTLAPSVPTRRDFLSTLALAGAALPLASRAAEKKSAAPATATAPAAAPTSLSTPPAGPTTIHAFSKPMHQLSHAETAKLLAECGYGGIDYTVRTAQPHVLPARVEEDFPRAVDAAHAAGLKVEMITTDITGAREPHTEKVLGTAAKLGVKCYRLGNFNYDAKLGILGTYEKLQPALKELAALNASLGIHGAIQNHTGTRIGSPVWDLYFLLRDIDPRALGVQYDIRHGTTEGGASWPLALKLLAPWIRCTDMKDFKWQQSPGKSVVEATPLGEGIVPLDAYLKLYRELNLTGPMSVHHEYAPFEKNPKPLTKDEQRTQFAVWLKKDMAVLKAAMARNGVS